MVATSSPETPRPRPKPGAPCELIIWRCLPNESRGERRVPVDNIVPEDLEAVASRWPHGPGRFRLEYRDAKRAVVHARYFLVPAAHEGRRIVETHGRMKKSARRLPPPRRADDPPPVEALASRAPMAPGAPVQASNPGQGAAQLVDPFLPEVAPPEGFMAFLHATAGWTTYRANRFPPEGYVHVRCSAGVWVVVPEGRVVAPYTPQRTAEGEKVYVWAPPPKPQTPPAKRPASQPKRKLRPLR